MQQIYRDARFRAWLEIERQKGHQLDRSEADVRKGQHPSADHRSRRHGLRQRRQEQARCLRSDVPQSEPQEHPGDPASKYCRTIGCRTADRAASTTKGRSATSSCAKSRSRTTASKQHLGFVTADYSDGNNKPQNAADGNPLTGWSINGGQGHAHEIVFNLAEPILKPGKLELSMLFEKYYAAGLGKFRVSVTTDNKLAEARGIPNELMPLLRKPAGELTLPEWVALWRQFIGTGPGTQGPARRDSEAPQWLSPSIRRRW